MVASWAEHQLATAATVTSRTTATGARPSTDVEGVFAHVWGTLAGNCIHAHTGSRRLDLRHRSGHVPRHHTVIISRSILAHSLLPPLSRLKILSMDVPSLWSTFARWLSKGHIEGGGHHVGVHNFALKTRATSQVSAPTIEIQLRPLSSSSRTAREHLSRTMPARRKPTTKTTRHYPTLLLPGGSCTPMMFMVIDGDSNRAGPSGDPNAQWTRAKTAKRRPAITAIFDTSPGSGRNTTAKAE